MLPPAAGCQCDVGGALGQGCEPRTGACLCRPSTQGPTCSKWVPPPRLGGWVGGWAAACPPGFSLGALVSGQGQCPPCPDRMPAALTSPAVARPAQDHYLPDLHQLRLELEEAATPEGHAVRFGFNPLEFESFSWRGYAQMTPIQVGGAWLSARCGWPSGGQAPEVAGPGWEWPGRSSPDVPRPPLPTAAQDRGKAERGLP